MTSPIDVEQSFRQSMASSGITTGDPIIADGKLHRFHVKGDKPGSKNGWFVLHSDSPQAGAFGCWKRGISWGWSFKDVSKLSKHEQTEYNRRIEQVKAERAQEQRRVWSEAQGKAQKWWKSAKLAPDSHPYLEGKQISSHGAKSYRNSLIVPLRDTDGVIHSLQYIVEDGTKRFLTGSRVSGCYFSFGKPDGVIYVAEGFSTAATVYEATKEAVVAAFSTGNLVSVAKSLREKFPDAQIVIAGDDDRQTKGNPGQVKAIEAAKAVGGLVVLPTFRDGQIGTDWNDLFIAEGMQVVKRQLEAAAPPPLSDNPQAEVDNWLASNSTELADILEPLKSMPLLQREQYRKRICEKADIRAGIFDVLVKVNNESESQGGVIDWENIVPWPEPVEGFLLLNELESRFQRFIILPPGAAATLPLWTVHTHCHEASFVSPYLVLTSPEKRCGKTLTLDLLNTLVPKSLPSSNISPSSLFRAVEKWRPTLLIDEADTFIKRNEELAGILNSGHTQTSAFVLRSVGDDFEPRRFSTWTPKAIALIGNLKDTLRDRSIIITMRRKTRGEKIERFRQDRTGEFEVLRRKIARWVSDHFDEIKGVEPEVPGILNDRQQDNWRPLLSIADIAGGEWPAKAREAAETLSGGGDIDSDSYRVQLLEDIQVVFEKAGFPETMKTSDLLGTLNSMEDRPWCEWRKGQPMSALSLSNLLRPFGVTPKTIRFPDREQKKGYYYNAFTDVFPRYLPILVVPPVTSNNINNLQDNLVVPKTANGTTKISRKSNKHNNGTSGTSRKPPSGGGRGQKALDSSSNLVQCGHCRYFVPNPKDAEKGVGECVLDAPFTKEDPPKLDTFRMCRQFEERVA